jgi:hypothetical protein
MRGIIDLEEGPSQRNIRVPEPQKGFRIYCMSWKENIDLLSLLFSWVFLFMSVDTTDIRLLCWRC